MSDLLMALGSAFKGEDIVGNVGKNERRQTSEQMRLENSTTK